MFGALGAVISISAAEYISYFALLCIIHSPSPNTFSLNPLQLHVNVSAWASSLPGHTCSTHWVFVHHPRMWWCKKRCHWVYFKKKRPFLLLLRRRLDFFFSLSHSMGRCFVHLLVKGPIFTRHCSSCFESSLTYSESAWGKLRLKKNRTEQTCSQIGGESIPDTCVPTLLANETAGCWSCIRDKHKPSSCPPTSRWSCVTLLLRSVLTASSV